MRKRNFWLNLSDKLFGDAIETELIKSKQANNYIKNFLNKINLSDKNNREKFYDLYKKAVDSIVLGVDQKVKGEDIVISDSSADAVIDFYNNKFKNECGPILMDVGVKRTQQGENMEYCQSSKPITFVGLISCLGIRVGTKGGVHLVQPAKPELAKTYFERLEWMRKLGGEDADLSIGYTTLSDMKEHLESLKQNIVSHKNGNELVSWFENRMADLPKLKKAKDGIVIL